MDAPAPWGNLLAVPDGPLDGECFDALLAGGAFRLERIVSTGQSSPPGFWYDQEDGEWVALLSDAAELQFEDEAEPRRLAPGDWLHIAPHRRHRVHWTAQDQTTVWLAIHYR